MVYLTNNKIQLFISVLIVVFGFSIFELRGMGGVTGLTSMTYDSLQYIKLIEGGLSEPPFSTRILLIYIGKILPFDPQASLFIVNCVSILFVLLGIFSVLGFLHFSNQVSILSVIAACSSFVFVYNFNNPYLTDLPAMASLVFFLVALQRRRFYLAIILCCISLLFRESIAALVPMFFLFFGFRQSVYAIFFAACAYMLPKILVAGNVSGLSLVHEITFLYLLKFFISYGVLWIAVALGYFTVRRKVVSSMKFEASLLLLSFAGAFLSSFHAADVTRMYFLMLPSIVIGLAYFFDFAINRGERYFIFIFVLLCVCLSILLVPNYFFASSMFDSLDAYIKSNSVWVMGLFILQIMILCKIFLSNKNSFFFLVK